MKPPDGSTDPTITPSQASTDAQAATVGDTVADEAPGERTSGRAIAGYELGATIGVGGMGEVVLARDPRIGRDVAIKRMRGQAPSPDAVDRFLREAKIQARLDHPAIVPVHELGHDPDGHPYFTMKRLTGTTLQAAIAAGESQHRMLRAFVDVCLAIEFAHARGVVHRDLKPSNIMLGDYGEVYVIDWGIARVIGERSGTAGEAGDISTLEGHTQAGALLGTPGYMAPEQVEGVAEVGPAADCYALGCILFEILAGEPLHPRGQAALATTLARPTEAPSARRPEPGIPPELDAACVTALSEDPAARPSARALGDRVQRYLDGDRDLERRRALAAEQLAPARAAAADPDRHVEAMRLAGRALALDPESRDAAALVTSLMLAPPREAPPELEARLRAADHDYRVHAARLAVASLLAFFTFVPVLLWSGVMHPGAVIGTYALIVALAGFVHRFRGGGIKVLVPAMIGNFVVAALLTRLLGPFVLAPTAFLIITMGLLAQPEFARRPAIVLGTAAVLYLLPLVLEATGALGSTWAIRGGALISTSSMIGVARIPTTVLLVAGNLMAILIAGLFSRGLAVARREAQQQVELHAWRLQQLVPVDAPRPTAGRGGAPLLGC